MEFEWDDRKDAANFKKHGVRFDEAKEIFRGPVFTWVDDRQDYGEVRKVSIGEIGGLVVLVVAHTARGRKTRMISARKANQRERKAYNAHIQKKA